MSDIFTGYVTEVGGKELGQSGKEKPRKIIVKDDLGAQFGKTFRVWANTDDFQKLRDAADNGTLVEVYFDQRPIPGREGHQNLVTSVIADGGPGPAHDPDADWEQPQQASIPQSAPKPAPKKYDQTTHEIEAAWALGVLLHFEEFRHNPALLAEKTKQLVHLKRQIASEL